MRLQVLLRSAAANSFAINGLDAEERTKFLLGSSLEILGWVNGTTADRFALTDDTDVAHGVDSWLSFLTLLTDFCIFAAGEVAGRYRAFRARTAVEARRAAELSLLVRALTHFRIFAPGEVAGRLGAYGARAAVYARRAGQLSLLVRTLTHFGICACRPVTGIDATCRAMAALEAGRARPLALREVGFG